MVNLNYLADQINFWSAFFLAQNFLKPVSSVALSQPSEITRFLKPVLNVALSLWWRVIIYLWQRVTVCIETYSGKASDLTSILKPVLDVALSLYCNVL